MPGDERGHGVFKVSVTKDYLTFSAAHFITIAGHKCESLHGHNYVVAVAVEARVDRETGFVVDFAVLKRILRPAIEAMDHKVLVPTENPRVQLRSDRDRTVVDYRGEARFILPTSNVALVPVTDTTAELLAEHLASHVLDGLRDERIDGITSVTVDIEESPGQTGTYRIELAARKDGS